MRFLKKLLGILPLRFASAHCDIPCGIYDPTPLQMAAHTVLRMTQMLGEAEKNDDGIEREHMVARLTRVKEEHGAIIESELGTFKNDYFKEEHFQSYQELKQLLKDAVKLSITTRQAINLDQSKELLEKVLQIAEVFYKSKNVVPVRVKSIYPTEGEIVTFQS